MQDWMQDQMQDSGGGAPIEEIESCEGVPRNVPLGNPRRSGESNSRVEELIISESRKLKE